MFVNLNEMIVSRRQTEEEPRVKNIEQDSHSDSHNNLIINAPAWLLSEIIWARMEIVFMEDAHFD